MEENPEMFGQVIMLYINCQIDGHNVKAFVDSGAQMTIMSSECARNCGLTDLIDVRFSGIAQAIFKKTSKSSSTENPVFQVYMYIEKRSPQETQRLSIMYITLEKSKRNLIYLLFI